MKKKTLPGILLTLLLAGMLASAFSIQPAKAEPRTWYVDDDGGADFTKIQDAVDAASPGDTIQVFSGTYYEHLIVEKDDLILVGEERTSTTIDGGGVGAVIRIYGDNTFFSGFTVQNNGRDYFGVDVFGSDNNTIYGNKILNNNGAGLRLGFSTGNTVHSNDFTNNSGLGLFLLRSGGNTLRENHIFNNGRNFRVAGHELAHFISDIDTSNTIDGKILYYLANQRNLVIEPATFPNIGYLALVNSTSTCIRNLILNSADLILAFTNSSTVENLAILNTSCGIELITSFYNVIQNNTITGVTQGVRLQDSFSNVINRNIIVDATSGMDLYGSYYVPICGNMISGNCIMSRQNGFVLQFAEQNTIVRNTVADNTQYGIYLYGSIYNLIHHNNFINNTQQAYSVLNWYNVWDDGYPSGGNYWSDHVTIDDYSGVNQDEPGSDGIVDEPYIIDENNRDSYPLLKPWSPVIPATIDVDPNTLNLRSGGQWVACYIELPEGYNLSDIDVSTVMLEDTIPVYLLDVPAPHPVPTEIGDYDNDTMPDLMVKFNRTLVSELILSNSITDDHVTLTITGEVAGTPFRGEDTIEVILGAGGSRRRK